MNINRSPVQVNLFDVSGKRLRDEITIKLYNQRLETLSRHHQRTMKGRAFVLPGVPAFPHGLHEAFIKPSTYRAKSVFISVPAGKLGLIGNPDAKEETSFVGHEGDGAHNICNKPSSSGREPNLPFPAMTRVRYPASGPHRRAAFRRPPPDEVGRRPAVYGRSKP